MNRHDIIQGEWDTLAHAEEEILKWVRNLKVHQEKIPSSTIHVPTDMVRTVAEGQILAEKRIEEWKKEKNHTKVLYLSDLKLKKVPEIPMGVRYLHLDGNYLQEIKNIPWTVRKLYCNDNPLETLEFPENSFLQELYCYRTKLKSLDLPKYTETVLAFRCQIEEFPILDGMPCIHFMNLEHNPVKSDTVPTVYPPTLLSVFL